MASQRRAGLIQVQVNGEVFDARGNWTYNLGLPKREALVGADAIHGYKETPQVPFVEGEITDRGTLDVATLMKITDATVTLKLANGKTLSWGEAWFAGDGNGQTEEANIAVRFESSQPGEEIS